MYPEIFLQFKNVYAVCVGEGEAGILAYCDHHYNAPNFIIKLDNKIIRNPVVVMDLFPLPPEDKEIFPLGAIIAKKNFQLETGIGRGCAYGCTYCINKAFLDKTHLNGLTVRIKHPETAIAEIVPYVHKYNVQKIAFIDDDFLIFAKLYPEEMKEFYRLYMQNVGLPFVINTNPLSITPQNIIAAITTGCVGIRIGIESSERLRKDVLNRHISNELIISKVRLARQCGIKDISTYNMIGLPGETSLDINAIFDLNNIILADFVKISTFYPFKGTALYDTCARDKMIDFEVKAKLTNFETKSCLKFSDPYLQHLETLQHDFTDYLNHNLPAGYQYKMISRGLAKLFKEGK